MLTGNLQVRGVSKPVTLVIEQAEAAARDSGPRDHTHRPGTPSG
jgi:polyisoprenoid-binding protein YceI